MATTRRSRRHDGGSPQQPPHLRLTNPAHPHSLDPSDPALDPWSLTRHQRLAAHLDSLRPRRGLPVTLNPSDPRAPFAVDFSLVVELAHSKWEYLPDDQADASNSPGSWFSIRAFPHSMYDQLSRLQEWASDGDPKTRPGLSPTVAACLFYGVAVLNQDPNVARFQALKSALDRADDLTEDAEYVYRIWRRTSVTDLFDKRATRGGDTKINVHLPEDIKDALREHAHSVGCSESSVAMVALSQALAECPSTFNSARGGLESTVASYQRLLRYRTRTMEMLIAEWAPTVAAQLHASPNNQSPSAE